MKKAVSNTLVVLISISAFSQELIDKIPLQLVDNLIFIQLHVNTKKEPLNFMFDSGAGVTAIDEKVSNELKLDISGRTKIGTSGQTLETKESSLNKLKVSDNLTIDSLSLYIMDLSHISEFLKMKVDGIIGFDLLNQVIVETNISELEMRFFDTANYRYHGNANASKLIMLESNHFGLPIEIKPKSNSNPLLLIVKIDKGAPNYLTFHNDAINKHGLMNPQNRYKIRKGFGADSTMTSNLKAKIASAKFSSKQWKNVPVIFEVDSLNQSSKRKADGLIGQEMLLDFNITYHLNDQVLYLEKR